MVILRTFQIDIILLNERSFQMLFIIFLIICNSIEGHNALHF